MSQKTDPFEKLQSLVLIFKALLLPFNEIYLGVISKRLPLTSLTITSAMISYALYLRLDVFIFKVFGIIDFYPYNYYAYWTCYWALLISPFWFWGSLELRKKRLLQQKLKTTFINASLKTAIGRVPSLIADFPIDECSRKLRLRSVGIPEHSFKSAKREIESNLQIYIDEIRSTIETGEVEMTYSSKPIPKMVEMPDINSFKNFAYCAGFNRTRELLGSFKEHPHLLVAGQSGAGKSTFLRSVITTIYLNHKNCEMSLIDLKGGLEFQLFERLPRVRVLPHVLDSIAELRRIKTQMDSRMEILKRADCKDLDQIFTIPEKKRKTVFEEGLVNLNRRLIVVDEAADIFLVNHETRASDVQEARKVLSEIARKGRACGFHLVIGTQRPDVKSLDPQIKANLSATMCFHMQNNASSMTVLDSGRATLLPDIPGRGIWKTGNKMTEVQVPFLDYKTADALLSEHRVNPKEPNSKAGSEAVSLSSHEEPIIDQGDL